MTIYEYTNAANSWGMKHFVTLESSLTLCLSDEAHAVVIGKMGRTFLT
jgi:hypothetical protein